MSDEPKILVMGKICCGKSKFIQNMATESINIEIGDGSNACTTEISNHSVTIKGTSLKVTFIDTPGLDQDKDEETYASIKKVLETEKNIKLCLFIIKKGERISGSFVNICNKIGEIIKNNP